MPDFSVTIEGLDKMKAAFAKAPAAVAQEMNAAIAKSIVKLIQYAEANFEYFEVTKNPNPKRTGYMMGLGRGLVDSYGFLKGFLTERAPYAIFVHEGTSKMQPARPFFRLAVEAAQPDVDGFFQTALSNILRAITF